MSAQSAYLSSIFTSFSTFLAERSVVGSAAHEATLALAAVIEHKTDWNNWDLQRLATFWQSAAGTQHATEAQALVTAFVRRYPPTQINVFLHEFCLALKVNGCSHSTVKNYRSDINQFAQFAETHEISQLITKPKVLEFLRQQREAGLKHSSIRRKLVSVQQFALWAASQGVLPQPQWFAELFSALERAEPLEVLDAPASSPKSADSTTARVTTIASVPVRAAQLTTRTLENTERSPMDHQERTAQLQSSLTRVARKHLGNRNLQGGKSAASWALTALVLLVSLIGIGFFGYQQFLLRVPTPFAYPTTPTRPNRQLSFQGRLTDTVQNPITSATDMRFYLYDSGPTTGSGTQLWDSGTCSVTPDQDGIFSVGLGDDCGTEITEDVFSENSNVWLEVEIDSETLDPRQAIQTVPYALNSETLQGYPIDASGAATINTVVTMNSGGEIVLGEVSPTIRSTSGTFSLEAQTLSLETSSGSNGDIILSPDGTGEVQINADTVIDGYLYAPGATLSATYAGGTALVARSGPSGTASIQEWQDSSGAPLSVVDASGNVGIGTSAPTEKLHIVGGSQLIDSSGLGTENVLSIFDTVDILAVNKVSGVYDINFGNGDFGNGTFFQVLDSTGNIDFRTFTGTINIDNLLAGGAIELNASKILVQTGNLGINTATPGEKLDVAGNFRLTGTTTLNSLTYTWPASQTNGYVLSTNGSGTLSWSDPAVLSGGTNLWDSANGALYPKNATLDLLIGGTATTSAKFAFLNVDSGTPTASVSAGAAGGTYLTSQGKLATTALQNLTLGDSTTTGDVIINPSRNVGIGTTAPERKLHVSGGAILLDFNQALVGEHSSGGTYYDLIKVGSGNNVTVGSTSQDTRIHTASNLIFSPSSGDAWVVNASSIYPITNNARDLGTSSNYMRTGYFGTSLFSPTIYGGTGASSTLTLAGTNNGSPSNAHILLNTSNQGNVGIGTTSPTERLQVGATGGSIGIGTTGNSASNTLRINRFNYTNDSVSTAGQLSLFHDDTSDIYLMNLPNNGSRGFVLYPTALTDTTTAGIELYTGRTIANASGIKLSTTQNITGNSYNVGGVDIANTISFDPTNNLVGTVVSGARIAQTFAPNATTKDVSYNGLYFGSTINQTGSTTATTRGIYINPTLTSAADFRAIDIANNSSSSYGIYQSGSSTDNYFAGNIGIGSTTPTEVLDIVGNLKLSGTTTFNSLTYTWPASQSNGYVLSTNGSGTLSWTDPNTLVSSGDDWDIASGALYPKNSTLDLLIGGTASTSAKFAFLNVDSGTPTASISAGTAGGAYLTSQGKLATTALQNLTLGDSSTTGDVWITPNRNVGIGTTSSASKLTVVSSGNIYASTIHSTHYGLKISSDDNSGTRKLLSLTNLAGGTPGGGTEVFGVLANGNVGIATTTPTYKLDVAGTGRYTGAVDLDADLELNSTLTDVNGSVGTSGQILSSTATGVDWIDAPAAGFTSWTIADDDTDTYSIVDGNILRFTSSDSNVLTNLANGDDGDENMDFSVRLLGDAVAGTGLTGGSDNVLVGADADVTFNIGAGNGITVNADDIAVNQAYNFSWTGTHSWSNSADFNGDVSVADTNISLDGTSTTFTQTTGAISFAPAAGTNLNVSLSGAGDFIVNTNDLVVDTSSGNIGIGSTTPAAALDIVGDIYVSSGLSTFNTAVSDDTIEATRFCTGDGETNCVTDFSALPTLSGWTDDGTTVRLSTATDYIAIGANTTHGKVGIDGARVGQALLVLDEEGDQDIWTASASGTNVARLSRTGDVIAKRFMDWSNTAYYLDAADSTTSLLTAGNIGIGTTTASQLLHVNGGTTDTIATFRSSDDTARIDVQDNDTTGYVVAKDTYLSLGGNNSLHSGNININTSSGNVGLGTTAPAHRLDTVADIEGLGSTTYAAVSGNINKSGASGQGGASAIALRGYALATGAGGLGQIAALDLTFGASAGGITTGAYGIRINNLTNAVTIANTYGLYIGDLSTGTQTNTPYSIYASDTNTRNYLAGNLGVGTTVPGQKLDVSGEIELANYLYFGNAATEYLRWDGSSSFILTDDFVPSGSGYGLGSLSAYWGTAYLSGLDINDGSGNAGVIQPLASDMLSFGEFASYDFKDTGLTSFATLSAPPAAATSGTVLNIKPALTAMNGSDTVSLLGINASNANHTTGSNFLYGINVSGITADAEATEVGLLVDSGWDISAIFSGNVGIGDSTPDATLELLSTTEQLRLTHTDGVDETNFTVDTDGNLTINNSGTKTMFSDDVQITGNDILDSSATTRISLGATTTFTNTTTTLSGTTTLTASSLATITSSSALSLGGATSLTFTSDNATIYGSDAANGNLTLHGTSNGTRTTSYVLLQPTAGNVGIGTTAPITTLDIQGAPITDGALQFQTVIANSTTAYNSSPEAGISFYNKYNSGGSSIGMGGISVGKENTTDGNYSSYMAFHSRVNGFPVGERARITASGNLGIATTTVSQTLHVEGTARITQSVSVADDRTLCTLSTSGDIELKNGACGTSSIRYKENVESLSYGLEQIQLMRPVFFNYKAYQEGDLTRTKRRVGFIAEEMDLIAPEVVIHDETGLIDGIDYAYLTAVLANGIQQQQAQLAVVASAQQNLALDSVGQVTISQEDTEFVATATNTGTRLNNIAGFADVVAARLTAGLTTTRQLVVQQSAQIADLSATNITIAGQSLRNFVASIVRDTVQEEGLVSPLAQVTLDEDESFTVTNPSGATIASIDATGKTKLGDLIVTSDASVSGTITSARLTALGELTAGSASISGELIADTVTAATISAESVRLATLEGRMAEFESIKAQTADLVNATVSGTLYANNIDGFGSKVAAAFDEPSLLEILLQKTGQSPAATESAAPGNLADLHETISTVGIDASSSAELNLTLADLELTTEDATLTASAAFINDYLKVNGSAYINNSLAVRQNLFVGEGMQIADGFIEYTAAPDEAQILAIQPSGKGTLSLLAGLMELNENGQINITGNLAVAGDVKVEGSLLSNLLQPAEYGNPFQVQVAGIATESGQVKESRFEIVNELGSPVATISAQGRAAFAGGIGIGSESLGVADSETDSITAHKTSGKAKIAANFKEVIIKSELLTGNSLIYVTPVGSTENKVLYVKSQTAENNETSEKEGQFVVGFDEAIGQEVEFNWWVVN